MSEHPTAETASHPPVFLRWMGIGWLFIAVVVFALTSAVAYRPSADTTTDLLITVLAPLVLVGMVVALADMLTAMPALAHWAGVATAVGGWCVLIAHDDRWTLLTMALYGMAFATGRWTGIAIAALVSIGWLGAEIASGAPTWFWPIPIAVFLAGSVLSLSLYQSEEVNTEQADLIGQLRAAQRDLAASERAKGVLEERARFANEIHDTLAQGFTSIVLLSRAAMRSGSSTSSLAAIEEIAQENLAAARRLVEAVRPPELESVSLPDALDRQITSSLPDDIDGRFRVVGNARQLSGAVEVTLLRATQEALLNVRTHAAADSVDVTLSYLDDAVALDVRDDGVGFVPGTVADRGSLTGGQGLAVLEHRARSLDGELTIESGEGRGSVVSVQLPTGNP